MQEVELSRCMQDGVEEAFEPYYCMEDVPTTFACLMIQTTFNTHLEPALCMEFSRGEKENFTTTILLCCALCMLQ